MSLSCLRFKNSSSAFSAWQCTSLRPVTAPLLPLPPQASCWLHWVNGSSHAPIYFPSLEVSVFFTLISGLHTRVNLHITWLTFKIQQYCYLFWEVFLDTELSFNNIPIHIFISKPKPKIKLDPNFSPTLNPNLIQLNINAKCNLILNLALNPAQILPPPPTLIQY